MATMIAMEPVTLVIELTVAKKTENGLIGGYVAAEVLTANGEVDPRYYGFINDRGYLVLNYKAGGRPAKPVKPAKADKAAPKALTAAQKAQIPGPATKPVKGKAKAAPAPKPAPAPTPEPAAPALDIQAMIQAEIAKALAALTSK